MKTKSNSNKSMALVLRGAASALEHGRAATACKKVGQIHRELNERPRPLSMNNEIRAYYGGRAIATGNPDHDEDDIRTSTTDTLANIMHFCHQQGLDFRASLASATMHFNEERKEGN